MAYVSIKSQSERDSLGILTGAGGADYVSAATVNADTYVAITALDAATITATSVDNIVWDDLSAIEVPAGCTIYGRWSEVIVGTGDKAYVYREGSST